MGVRSMVVRVRSSGATLRALARARDRSGQMTVEFAVAFPVLIVVAAIAANVLLFLADCAEFDRVAREAVRVHAAVPAFEQTAEDGVALVEAAIAETLDPDRLAVSVALEGTAQGHSRYTATLRFTPTLFGLGLRQTLFGAGVPSLSHSVSLAVDPYKPGVLL